MTFFRILSLSYILLLFSGCSNIIEELPEPRDQECNIRLIFPRVFIGNRFSFGLDAADPQEKFLADKLYVVILNSDGTNCFSGEVEIDPDIETRKVTKPFKVTSGQNKSIFVYSVPGKYTGFPSFEGVDRTMLSNTVFDFDFGEEGYMKVADRSVDNLGETAGNANIGFMNQTLWQEGGYAITDPKGVTTIDLDIGRPLAKVHFAVFSKGTESTLQGEFSEPTIRLASIPTKVYAAGRYEGSRVPVAGAGIKVISAVHTTHYNIGNKRNPVYYDYPWKYGIEPEGICYVNENTSVTFRDKYNGDETDALRYGTVTYFQLITRYTPASSELVNRDVPDSDWDGTFYQITMNDGTKFLSWEDPEGKWEKFGMEENQVRFTERFPEGWCMYYAPLSDKTEPTPELQCRTLRNHYYGIQVEAVRNLKPCATAPLIRGGKPEPEPQPVAQPIGENTDLKLNIRVDDWSVVDLNLED